MEHSLHSSSNHSNQEKLIYFLRSTNLVSATTAREIASNFRAKHINKHDFHLQEGQILNEYLFLDTGFMRAFAHNTEGNEVTTNFYAQNQVVFEVSSFFNRIPSRENIQALTNCSGWYITYEQVNKLFHSIPEFREFGRSMLVQGFSALKIRMLSMITDTAEERYTKLLHTNPEIFQNASLKTIASYLGITDTSLSRIRKEFSRK
ncbi:Crp/Fnr family transcriptional regulator [Cytophagaceae bacterium YF14B1]|uniref:Crp/Fnr family transcriptional regulator n=1 Tax=Xanthocytophaga flava TaxID=3048013 RepID=A0AAE3QTJ4_9BACT|nr:Crp/Fnr family transcriptional regulator [Xanthocytophaga flavus]MDJ1483200.1 Crp/Fnr family transcriptional regulator [Xanthocytophaga flavus]